MVNKEKLLLLATIYMLVPGAMPDALADNAASETKKPRAKKAQTVKNVTIANQAAAVQLQKKNPSGK